MAKNLEQMLAERPVDRGADDAHKARMIEQVRAYRLQELRESVAMTQKQQADRLGLGQNRVPNIEHGDLERVQIDTLRRYVEAVGGALRVEVELGDERFQIAKYRRSKLVFRVGPDWRIDHGIEQSDTVDSRVRAAMNAVGRMRQGATVSRRRRRRSQRGCPVSLRALGKAVDGRRAPSIRRPSFSSRGDCHTREETTFPNSMVDGAAAMASAGPENLHSVRDIGGPQWWGSHSAADDVSRVEYTRCRCHTSDETVPDSRRGQAHGDTHEQKASNYQYALPQTDLRTNRCRVRPSRTRS